jgi:hypothetical protein
MGEVLSVVGTIVGILAGLAGLYAFMRRRERVRVGSVTVFGRPAVATLEFTATNIGTQDVTLVDLGFAVARLSALNRRLRTLLPPLRQVLLRRGLRSARRYSDLGIEDEVPVTIPLRPTQRVTRRIDMEYAAGWLTPGESVWPYLTTSLGLETYSVRPADIYVWQDEAWHSPQ